MTQVALSNLPGHFQQVLEAVLAAADPAEALVREWPKDPKLAEALQRGVLIAAGKASLAMTRAAVERCGVRPAHGVLLAPAGTRPAPSIHAAVGGAGLRMFEADHPLPSQRNLIAARAAADAARVAASRRLPLVVLLSGGVSAFLTVPERAITLSDIRNVTDALMRAGATITELNTVRSCCDQLKAGGLARIAAPAPSYSFILSDVLGDPVDIIGSGPTADTSPRPREAMEVLERHTLIATSPNVVAHLKTMLAAKPEGTKVPVRAWNRIIASNASAVIAASDALRALGYSIAEAQLNIEGAAATRGKEFAARLISAQQAAAGKPVAILWGGETTVNVGAKGGFGGRNQEAALSAALALEGKPNLAALFFATDGVDGAPPPGKPPHAGAVISGESVASARRVGKDAATLLSTHDSHAFAEAAGVAIRTGPTGTNVNDIWVGVG